MSSVRMGPGSSCTLPGDRLTYWERSPTGNSMVSHPPFFCSCQFSGGFGLNYSSTARKFALSDCDPYQHIEHVRDLREPKKTHPGNPVCFICCCFGSLCCCCFGYCCWLMMVDDFKIIMILCNSFIYRYCTYIRACRKCVQQWLHDDC